MRKWYLIAMSVLTIALAAALIWQAADIYATGHAPENILGDGVYAQQIYRTEDIRARMQPIAWLTAGWLAMAIGGAIAIKPIPQRVPGGKMKHSDEKHIPTTRIILAVAAVALIVLGVANGGMRDVLIKAINICTECIGLG